MVNCSQRSEASFVAFFAWVLLLSLPSARAETPVRPPLARSVLVPIALGQTPFVDLESVTRSLEELSSAGAEALLLSPFFRGTAAPTHAVVDHSSIEPAFGDEVSFAKLVDGAHAAGLSLMLDLHANDVSVEHEWFRAAQGGDRFHRSLFVLASELPPKARGAKSKWTFDEGLNAHYYHAAGPGRVDLDLRDEALRARIVGIARYWRERGVDGLRVLGSRVLFEDGLKERLDRPGSLAFFRELKKSLPPPTALLAELRATSPTAARYFGEPHDGADLVIEHDRIAGFQDALSRGSAEVLLAAIERAERVRPSGSAWSLRASEETEAQALPEPFATAFLLTVGGQPWRSLAQLQSPLGRALVALRARHPGLRGGAFEPQRGVPPEVLVFVRRDGLDEVLVALSFAEGGEVDLTRLGASGPRVDLASALLHSAELDEETKKIRLGLGGVFVAPLARPDLPYFIEMSPEWSSPSVPQRLPEFGGRFEEQRGAGFSEDRRRSMVCEHGRGGRTSCLMPFEGGAAYDPGTRYSVAVPAGAYEVQVMTRGRPIAGQILIEGEIASASKVGFRHVAFSRDGQISVDAAPGSKTLVTAVRIEPLTPGVVELETERVGRSIRVESPMAGALLWRMDESSTEPVEVTPLVKTGRRHAATLGPWPPGVRSVRLLLRGEGGRIFAGPDGLEIVVSLPTAP